MTETGALWTAAEAAAATGGRAIRQWRADGVSIDSRHIAKGDLFVAIAGPRHDGHGFVADALAAGAAAAMVHEVPANLPADAPLLIVDDTLDALGALARAARPRITGHAIAVTGSAGKTSTKEALRHVLGKQAPTTASEASLNNRFGVPLTMARLPRGTKYGVFEVGMNHAGEITPLSRLITPDIAVITNISEAHTAFFPSLDAVADAKAEIFAGMNSHGTAILNRDNAYYPRLAAAARAAGIRRVISFGADEEADIRLIECVLGPDSSQVSAEAEGAALAYQVGLPGQHWVINSLAVLAVVHAAGADLGAAMAALAHLPALAGRGVRETIPFNGGTFILIDESYNANPASMRAAIETLGAAPLPKSGRRIAVLGDMRELGDTADRLHAGLAQPLTRAGIDLVFTAGNLMRHLDDALPAAMRGGHADNAEAMAEMLGAALAPGDAVMVKGSLASRMGVVVELLRGLGDKPKHAMCG